MPERQCSEDDRDIPGNLTLASPLPKVFWAEQVNVLAMLEGFGLRRANTINPFSSPLWTVHPERPTGTDHTGGAGGLAATLGTQSWYVTFVCLPAHEVKGEAI